MKALRLKIFQEYASYRVPYSFENIETYPLPPYSTVLGLVHNAIGATRTIEGLRVSVQGTYGGIIRNYVRFKKYKSKGVEDYPIMVSELQDVELLIHVHADDEEILKQMVRGFQAPPRFLYMGRPEDLIFVEEVNMVDLHAHEPEDSYVLEQDAYIPLMWIEENGERLEGILYRLEEYYRIMEGLNSGRRKRVKNTIRVFNRIPVMYVQKGAQVYSPLTVDADGNPVWLSR